MDCRLAVRAAIVREGKLLLIGMYDSRVDAAPDTPHYNIPGGGVEAGESIVEAMRREVLEETGSRIEVGRLLLVAEWVGPTRPANLPDGLEFVFECRLLPGEEPMLQPQPCLDPSEVDLRWVPLEEVRRMRLLCIYAERLIQAVTGTDQADPYYQFAGDPLHKPVPDA